MDKHTSRPTLKTFYPADLVGLAGAPRDPSTHPRRPQRSFVPRCAAASSTNRANNTRAWFLISVHWSIECVHRPKSIGIGGRTAAEARTHTYVPRAQARHGPAVARLQVSVAPQVPALTPDLIRARAPMCGLSIRVAPPAGLGSLWRPRALRPRAGENTHHFGPE